jgi:hypothetical protein
MIINISMPISHDKYFGTLNCIVGESLLFIMAKEV